MNGITFETFDRRGIRGRRFYWRLRAANGEIVAQSEGYTSAVARDAGVKFVRKNARTAPIEAA